jgi:DNA mismatch endonuclease Vsr
MEMVIVADIFSKDKRSDIMKSIKGKNTKIENITAEWLHSQGFEFTMYDKELPGKPDFVLPKYKTVIFTHGCFWHGHENCKASELPATNREFWEEKIGKNKAAPCIHTGTFHLLTKYMIAGMSRKNKRAAKNKTNRKSVKSVMIFHKAAINVTRTKTPVIR